MKTDLLNCKTLAERMGQGPGYVSAMKAAGYSFEFGTKTTLKHALRWRRRNPDFRTTAYYRAHREQPADDSGGSANKSCEPVHSNGR